MRLFFLTIFILSISVIWAQTDSIIYGNQEFEYPPTSKYLIYKYDSINKIDISIYEYSNLWDIDGDEINDTLQFIGNGGAHTYFYLKIKLSSNNAWYEYPTFQIDFPYIDEKESITKEDEFFPQFVVDDFNNDGNNEVYLNITSPYASIPKNLEEEGVNSNRLIINFENGRLRMKNYKD